MVDHPIVPIKPTHPTIRRVLVATVIMVAVALFICVLTIPFSFESPSMYYKFGWDKILLRCGKLVGLTAAVCLLLQLPLAGRFKWLDRLFSLPVLYTVHRYNAGIILVLVIVHPIAVFAPDGILMIPFEARYWPEWVGAGLLLVILLQWSSSYWRDAVFKSYEKWLLIHRITGMIAMAMLTVHILYVSETFEQDGLPRTATLVVAAGILMIWCWVRLQGLPIRKKALQVLRMEPAGENAYAVAMKPKGNQKLAYAPGQFAFLSFDAKQVSKEPHPFTLSSTSTNACEIEVTIRGSGDWTRQIQTIAAGDTAYIQGPYGRFSHLLAAPQGDLIMIAGGIGITPMLSMLRYMRDVGDSRRIIVIWSNKTPRHLFNVDELKAMEKKLTGLRWIPIFTREKGDQGYFGRLNRHLLESLLQSYDRETAIFLCGPPPMIKQVRLDLLGLGFPKRLIHSEAFGY